MKYRVATLTHGSADELERTLDRFMEMVTPSPNDWVIAQDGEGGWTIPEPFTGYVGQPWAGQVGYCEATRRLWQMASKAREQEFDGRGTAFYIPSPPDYIFWLEHDFVLTRPLDLEPLAAQLDEDHRLAQIALMRNAVNEQELEAGGLVESRDGEYALDGSEAHPYLRHRSYFTTNPSLMRTAFMQANPWPEHAATCEGLFGMELVELGYDFAAWGSGEPWCRHIGERTGKGY